MGTKIAEIDSFTNLIKDKIEKRNTIFVPNRTGNSIIHNKLQKADDLYLMIDIFQEMADTLSKGPYSETEAYCILNVVKINFSIFKNYDFDLYYNRKRRIDHILDKLEEENDDDDDDEIKRPSWYEQYQELYEEIKKKERRI